MTTIAGALSTAVRRKRIELDGDTLRIAFNTPQGRADNLPHGCLTGLAGIRQSPVALDEQVKPIGLQLPADQRMAPVERAFGMFRQIPDRAANGRHSNLAPAPYGGENVKFRQVRERERKRRLAGRGDRRYAALPSCRPVTRRRRRRSEIMRRLGDRLGGHLPNVLPAGAADGRKAFSPPYSMTLAVSAASAPMSRTAGESRLLPCSSPGGREG